MLDRVNEVLENKVRPYLRKHYGDIEVVGIEDEIVEVKLLGSCSGCPSAKYTVEEIVETALMKEISGIKKVELVSFVSEDLLDMAKKILNRHA